MPVSPPVPQAKALILAAGRGERMRPLTDTCPKPLLPVHGRPMIEWHLRALAAAGVREVVINTAWLEAMFPPALGDGERFGLTLHWSPEGREHGGALETAGGLATALPRLGVGPDDPLWLVSGDIHAPDFVFSPDDVARFAAQPALDAWLWLVPNPDFKQAGGGDFALSPAGRLHRPDDPAQRPWTYANLALVRPRLVAGLAAGVRAPLAPYLFAAAAGGRLGGQPWHGAWANVGTPQQLAALNAAPLSPAS